MNRMATLERWAYGTWIDTVTLSPRAAIRLAKQWVNQTSQRPVSRHKIWRKPNGESNALAITDYTCLPDEGVGARVALI